MARNYHAELYYHFVWRTKGNLALVQPHMEAQLYEFIKRKCVELGAVPIEVNSMPDHVHLVIGAEPTLLLSTFVGQIKGAASHYLNTNLNPAKRVHWNDGYGVLSLARRDLPAVRKYVRDQKKHHTKGTTNENAERVEPN